MSIQQGISRTEQLRQERELVAREAADRLLVVIGELEKTAILLAQAGQPALHHRTRTVQAAANRLQTDVAGAIGDLVRERVVEELSRRADAGQRRSLSIA